MAKSNQAGVDCGPRVFPAVAIAAVVTFGIICGCTALRHENERAYYREAYRILARAVPRSERDRCGLYAPGDFPDFIPVSRNALQGNVGIYRASTREIFYDEETPEIIRHEATHELLHGASRDCVEQVAACYAQEIGRLTEENDRLRARGNKR